MTAISMHATLVPLVRQLLGSLDDVLRKGEAFAEARRFDPAVLLGARLAPDMQPLTRQVQIACDTAKAAAARLGGVENPRYADDETSFPQLHERIAKTLAFVEGVPASAIDGSEERDITVPARETLHFKGSAYLVHWVIPNVTFHVTTAYAILRHNGVEIGKRDFLGRFDVAVGEPAAAA